MVRPVNVMSRKDAPVDRKSLMEEPVDAIDQLKARLAALAVLELSKRCLPCMVDCHACAYETRTVLLQQHNLESPKEWATVGYWARLLRKGTVESLCHRA